MILGADGPGALPGPRGHVRDDPSDAGTTAPHELRQMAVHLETAAVLEERARRVSDPAQQQVLRRRAEQRRREAARLRARLADRGMALGRPQRSR